MAKKQEPIDASAGDMTPMIDMVFQLLIFFILMFKIVAPEGDFSIKMPTGGAGDPGDNQPILLRLYADKSGNLTDVTVGNNRYPATSPGLNDLQNFMRKELGKGGAMASNLNEIDLDCDYNLKYSNVISIISKCTGYVENGEVVMLAEKIKFRAPRKPEE